MINVICIMVFFVIATALHLLGHSIACLVTGVRIDKIQFFYGKEIFKLNWKIITVSFGWLPTGGSVFYDIEQFQNEKLFTRLFIVFCGPIFLLISAAIFIKYDLALEHFISGFSQIIVGALSPIQKGSVFVNNYFKFLNEHNYVIAYGIFAAKLAAFNLLPIATLTGSRLLFEILKPYVKLRTEIAIMSYGVILVIIISVLWFIALIYSFN